MVEENAIRADVSPWEQALLAVRARDGGYFDTVDAAIDGLYRSLSRDRRYRMRTLADLVEELYGLLTAPETLSLRRLLRLAAANARGYGELMTPRPARIAQPRARDPVAPAPADPRRVRGPHHPRPAPRTRRPRPPAPHLRRPDPRHQRPPPAHRRRLVPALHRQGRPRRPHRPGLRRDRGDLQSELKGALCAEAVISGTDACSMLLTQLPSRSHCRGNLSA